MNVPSLIENYQSFYLSSKNTFSTLSSNSFGEIRGRQLFSSRINISKRAKLNINITNSKNSTCESKHITSNDNNINNNNIRIHKKNKRNKINSISKIDNSDDSLSSSDIRKKNFYEEEIFNYPTKSDVGLISSEEESIGNDPHLKFKLENEIESILIEIYNKNFPSNDKVPKKKNHLLKRDKYKYLKKNNIEVNKNELKITFSQLNEKYNFFFLQILSKKIKELICKYKEKLFENEDLSKIYKQFKRKTEEINNKFFQKIIIQNELKNIKGKNKITTSSNIYDPNMLKKLNQFNSNKNNYSTILQQITKNIKNSNLGNTIFRELDNIKTSLKYSSIEIQQIFQYPLSLLKNQFSIECIQLEAFNNILIKDDLISTILFETKEQKKSNFDCELINSLENDKKYDKEEMTRFDKILSQKLKIRNNKKDNFINPNKDYFIDKDSIESDPFDNINDNIYSKKNVLSSSFSSIDSHINNNNINNKNNDESINNEEDNRLVDLDIDDLVKLIDSGDNNGQKKKKKKKNKKNKNKGNCVFDNNKINYNNDLNVENKNIIKKNSEEIEKKDFESIYNEFKLNINNSSLNYENSQKIKPKLSANWLMKLYTNGV